MIYRTNNGIPTFSEKNSILEHDSFYYQYNKTFENYSDNNYLDSFKIYRLKCDDSKDELSKDIFNHSMSEFNMNSYLFRKGTESISDFKKLQNWEYNMPGLM